MLFAAVDESRSWPIADVAVALPHISFHPKRTSLRDGAELATSLKRRRRIAFDGGRNVAERH